VDDARILLAASSTNASASVPAPAREESPFESYGHTVRLIAPHFVKPYVKTHKTDATDAEAICEAVNRPNMRFVPIKSIEQQSALSLHRVRFQSVRKS
jgi:transposase